MTINLNWRCFLPVLAGLSVLLTGCATTYTVDDGRPVNERLLAGIRMYGAGEQLLRPAIVRSGKLEDPDCDTQWELPFSVATSYDLDDDIKVAWVRGLNVDERLTVIAADPNSNLQPGERIVEIAGYSRKNTEKMIAELYDRRDSGKIFSVKTAGDRFVFVIPFKVCRGHVKAAPPDTPTKQDYHWREVTHPQELFTTGLTPDEALWVVLWSQGLSEEGGARMKTYHYGMKTIKTALTIAAIASGVGKVAKAAQGAAASASAAAGQVATSAASDAAAKAALQVAAQQIIDQAKKEVVDAVSDTALKLAKQQVMAAAQTAALNKAGLSGVSWVAGSVFDKADKWAMERIEKLGGDLFSPLTLHLKLSQMETANNGFVFDEERSALAAAFYAKAGLGVRATYLLSPGDAPLPPAVPAVSQETAPAPDLPADNSHSAVTQPLDAPAAVASGANTPLAIDASPSVEDLPIREGL